MAVGRSDQRQFRDIFKAVIPFSAALDPAAYVDNESQVLQVTVTGAAIGDLVWVAPGIDIAEVTYSAFVSAADTVDIVISMTGGDTDNIASSTWKGAVLSWDDEVGIAGE